MSENTLTIGTKRYSSWSLRAWLAVHLAGLKVREVVLPLAGGVTPAVRAASPSGMVPLLAHEGALMWESLAICCYCAELAPGLWPADRVARAQARAVSVEMHSGFRDLRQTMPMSLFRDAVGAGRTAATLADIARIEAIWAETLALSGGPFLNGASMGVADAMYAPVVFRFATYRPELSDGSQAYCEAMLGHGLMQRWRDEAAVEPEAWFLPANEAVARAS